MGGPVVFWVQHLLGSGHLKRAALIASALAGRDVETVIASGGMPLGTLDTGGARLVQLPPVRAGDGSFTELVDDAGRPADETYMERRRRNLEDLVACLRPGLVVTETWPFGRRKLGAEVLALLEAARRVNPGTLVVSSVRDILQRSAKPERYASMRDLALAHCDHVMVHGSTGFVPLSETFPWTDALGSRLVHTGYVAAPPLADIDPGGPGADEILVSSGGGAVGQKLLETAAMARSRSRRASGRTWRLLTGEGALNAVRARPGLVVETNRRDFPLLLTRCAVSVSQGGYNTVIDLIRARARAVICPWSGDGETEQAERARHMQARGMAEVLAEDDLSAQSLAEAVDRAFDLDPPDAGIIGLDGAVTSARLLEMWMRHG